MKEDKELCIDVKETISDEGNETGFKDIITRVNLMFKQMLKKKAYEMEIENKLQQKQFLVTYKKQAMKLTPLPDNNFVL